MRLPLPLLCGVLFGIPVSLPAQQRAAEPGAEMPALAAAALPDAPLPSDEVPLEAQTSGAQTGADHAATPAAQSHAEAQQTQRQKARAQLKEQEHQRVLGIFPAFNTSYRKDAVSLTAKEKMGLAFRSAIDPVAIVGPLVVAGLSEATNGNQGFGWGPAGYFKRTGAAYLDSFNARIIGKGILPSLLRQDPRYFRRGHGSVSRRLLYATGSVVICKHDVTGKWEPNYSNVGGNISAGMISNLYYPDTSASGVQKSLVNGLIVTAQGVAGVMFQEFWPDLSRKFLHKDPTHGLDAEAAAAAETAEHPKQHEER